MTDDTAVRGGNGGGGLILTPDPTVLTREAVTREIVALREILDTRIDGQAAVYQARFSGMDEAIKLLQVISDRLPAQMEARITQSASLMNERFNTQNEQFKSIGTQFLERDTRVQESATARDTAVAAALQAQKEAAGEVKQSFKDQIEKSDAATTKLLDALGLRIDDVRDRLISIESSGAGRAGAVVEQRAVVTDQRQGQGATIAIFGAVMLVVGTLIALGSLALVAAR